MQKNTNIEIQKCKKVQILRPKNSITETQKGQVQNKYKYWDILDSKMQKVQILRPIRLKSAFEFKKYNKNKSETQMQLET